MKPTILSPLKTKELLIFRSLSKAKAFAARQSGESKKGLGDMISAGDFASRSLLI